ncbi:MAG TPA: hypothetical protein VGI70_05645, partial [Polyangiales bacterium]
MRILPITCCVALVLSGCAVSAGVGARVGGSSNFAGAECDSFESCDLAYEDALAGLERCREEGDDCEAEERNLLVTYGVLREQTRHELETLRGEAEERDAALGEAEETAEAARRECGKPGHPAEPPPAAHHGN